jgi:apolipoprotein N-acyltransferase
MLKHAPRRSFARRYAADEPASAPGGSAAESVGGGWKTLTLGLAGSALLWAAFPPLDFPWLAWLAPAIWVWLARLPELPGRRPYLLLWLAGTVHWLAMLYGVRMAHPALNAGWVALAAYLGVYLPLFVGLTRVAVHRFGISVVAAAPVVWVGLELWRGHLMTGFSMALLSHTQAELPILIQISDLGGGYTLSLVIMLVAACLARVLPLAWNQASLANQLTLWPALPAAAAIAATLAYGQWRLNQQPPGARGPAAQVALIQGSLDTIFVTSREEYVRRLEETFQHYNSLTSKAVAEHENLDLVVWPESMFMLADVQVEEPLAQPEAALSAEAMRANLAAAREQYEDALRHEVQLVNANTAASRQTLFLFGSNAVVYGPAKPRSYNAAHLADRDGNLIGRYYKIHAVMFGEYIPFGSWLPFLYKLTPMEGGLSPGEGPTTFEVAGLAMSPSICFESTVPHLLRSQLRQLARQGRPADVLVNVTNDGWFWGSGVLDLHFRCGVFRAVENRKPLLVAANTGISTWVDGNGVIRARGPKRRPEVLVASVTADGRHSPYHTLGDWPAWACAAACAGLIAASLYRPRQDAGVA